MDEQEIYDTLNNYCGTKVKLAFTDVYSIKNIDVNEILRRIGKQKLIPTACVIKDKEKYWTALVYIPKSRYYEITKPQQADLGEIEKSIWAVQ